MSKFDNRDVIASCDLFAWKSLVEMFSDSEVLLHGAAGEDAMNVGDVLKIIQRAQDLEMVLYRISLEAGATLRTSSRDTMDWIEDVARINAMARRALPNAAPQAVNSVKVGATLSPRPAGAAPFECICPTCGIRHYGGSHEDGAF